MCKKHRKNNNEMKTEILENSVELQNQFWRLTGHEHIGGGRTFLSYEVSCQVLEFS